MISLLYPFVFLFGIVLSLVALVRGRKRIAIALLALSVALDIYAQCLPLRLFSKSYSSSHEDISVLAFNVHGPGEMFTPNEEHIASLVLDQEVDFILLTEYYEMNCSDTLHNRIVAAGYECIKRMPSSGNAFYTKTGAKQNTLKIGPSSNGNVTEIEASSSGKGFNMFFCHLPSNNYDTSARNYSTPDDIKSFEGLKFYLKRIEDASELRRQEVEVILEKVDETDSPTIILGDMNDVCGSPALRVLESAGFKDAWWKGGFGYGATIHDPLPFRIDHIMYNDGLKLRSIKKVSAKGLSDHDALVATFSIK